MWFTDATIAFVKETIANLENIKKDNAKLEEKLHYYERKSNQCYIVIDKFPDEFRKSMYVTIEPDEDTQKPVQLDEAFRILRKRVNEYTEFLELGKKHEELNADLLAKLTEAHPGILDEINN